MTVGIIIAFNILVLIIGTLSYCFKLGKFLQIFTILIVALLTASFTTMRDFNYGDTAAYIDYYNFNYEYVSFEIGFTVLSEVFRYFIPENPTPFIFFCSFLGNILVLITVKRFAGHQDGILLFWMFTCTYTFYYLNFEVLRQGIAIGFLFWGLSSLVISNNWRSYLVGVLIGSTFHSSIVIFLLLPFLYLVKNNRLFIYLFIITCFLSFFISELIFLFGNFIYINKALEYYLIFDYNSNTILIRNFLFFLFFPLIFKNFKSKELINFYILYLFILASTFNLEEINRRFLFIGTFLFVFFAYKFFEKSRNLYILVIIFLSYFFFFLINYNAMFGLLNYSPIFKFSFE